MLPLTPEEERVLEEVLKSQALQNLIGAEQWDLSEEDEKILWRIIRKVETA